CNQRLVMKNAGFLLPLALVMAGCATNSGPNLTTEERLALYRANSTPVGSFRIDSRTGRPMQWNSLGDQALTLRGQSNQPYLLELHTRCSGLTTASSIAVSHSFGTVMPRMDSVQPLAAGGRPSTFSSCNIATARRINQGAVNEARRDLKEAQREATPVERDPNAKADDAPN
ncbi:MAG TPA: DUF6491 family protein, partial [Pseudoxanthomonas sp.]|nr:DUF6491 family protein [Pseudoxanthomonas sp.]